MLLGAAADDSDLLNPTQVLAETAMRQALTLAEEARDADTRLN